MRLHKLWSRFVEWIWQFEPQRIKVIHEAERYVNESRR